MSKLINKRVGSFDNGTVKVRMSMKPWSEDFSEEYLEVCIPVTFEMIEIVEKALKERDEQRK